MVIISLCDIMVGLFEGFSKRAQSRMLECSW